MSYKAGLQLICDRCGRDEFREYPDDMNNYYAVLKHAEGWEEAHGLGLMCPTCAASYNETLRMFKNGTIGRPIENKQPNH